ncbi:MAG: SDR family oxidoreductase [Planctomycetia bacterium]|nr:SDR family oxidoreductase [Planctomycetia bacterium]
MPSAPLTLISGGSRGLGLALVEHLLARGDAVATFSRSGSAALSTLAKAHPGRLVVEPLDITDSAAIGGFIARVADRFGRLDHCIANAAIAHEGVLATMRDDEIDSMLAVNLRGAIVFIRECVRQMLAAPAAGPVPDRSITVVSSVVAENGSPGLSVYAATKAALEGLARSLARELGPRGIRVNAIAPGFLETDLSSTLPAEQRARIARRTALGRLGKPEDVAGAIEFLTSKAAGFSTGHVLKVDGGG